MVNRMMIFLFINFHPKGRAGGFHCLLELRSFGGGAWQAGQGLAIVHYGFALKCLAYKSLQLVQNSSIKQ